jgi:hypothetical protein
MFCYTYTNNSVYFSDVSVGTSDACTVIEWAARSNWILHGSISAGSSTHGSSYRCLGYQLFSPHLRKAGRHIRLVFWRHMERVVLVVALSGTAGRESSRHPCGYGIWETATAQPRREIFSGAAPGNRDSPALQEGRSWRKLSLPVLISAGPWLHLTYRSSVAVS